MANYVGTNPWTLDTASATPLSQNAMKIAHFEFVNYAASTDTAVLKNAYGKIVWEARGNTELEEVRSYKVGWIDGLALTTITSGAVLVFFE